MMYSPAEMAKIALDGAVYKALKKPLYAFISAILAGAFIAIAFVFYTTVKTGAADMPWGVANLLGGIVFSLGLMLVVVFGVDLFTSTTLTVIAKAENRISYTQMFKNWGIVYLGNLVGGLTIVALMWLSAQYMADNGQWGLTILKVSQHKLHHSWVEAFTLGILCNIMVCAGVWMSYAGKSLTDRTLILILPIAMFVASGFEHCVANMFMVPMGILIQNGTSPEFWSSINIDPSVFADLTIGHFITNNLIPVTLGNIVGGAFFMGLIQWFLHIRKH